MQEMDNVLQDGVRAGDKKLAAWINATIKK